MGPNEGRRWEASMRRRRKALDVSMVGGSIYVITSPYASKKLTILEIHGNFVFVVIFIDQEYHSKFTIIEIILSVV